MTTCGNCKERGQTVDHVKACYAGRTIQAQVLADPGNERAAFFGTEFTVDPADDVIPEEVLARNAPVTEAGFYQSGDAIYKVQIAVHGSGKPYAKILVIEEPDCGGCANGEPCGAGCKWTVRWEYAPGAIKSLRAGDRMTAEQAKNFSDLYGVCVFCTKPLTDERSIFAGYGEKCASNHGLPWGATE